MLPPTYMPSTSFKHTPNMAANLPSGLLVLCGLLIPTAYGHGFLSLPLSRNLQSHLYDPPSTREYTPNELSGGGVAYVGAGSRWPHGRWGVCGDRWDASPQKWLAPRAVSASYTAGQAIDLHFTLTATHKGRIAFRVCDSLNVTEECLNGGWLTRADSVFPASRYWYVESFGRDAAATRYAYNGSAFGGAPTYILKYNLPPGLTCEHCVLQWWYLTGNSCTPPCDPADPNYNPANPTSGCDKASMGICGQAGSYPEEFWNCADISIRPAGSPQPTPSPLPTLPPSPKPTPSPSTSPTRSPPPTPSTQPTSPASPRPAPTPSGSPSPTRLPSPSPDPSPSPLLSSGPCPTPQQLCQGLASGMFSNPCDATCGSFITCANGVGFVQLCPSTLRFDQRLQQCNWPDQVACSSPSPVPSSSPTPSPTPSPTRTPSPSTSPSPTRLPTPTPSPTSRPSPSPTTRPTPSPTTRPTVTPMPTSTPTPTVTAIPTQSARPTPTPTTQPAPTPSPSPSPSSNKKVIGYLESWRMYNTPGGNPPDLAQYLAGLTHINYAFASISYSPSADTYYLDPADTWSDMGKCLTGAGSCPAKCIKLTPNCGSGSGAQLSLVPNTRVNHTTCPAKDCYNPSGGPGYPRQCHNTLGSADLPYPGDIVCGHYAYVQDFIREKAPSVRVLLSLGGWYDSNLFSYAAMPKYRGAFVDSIIAFMQTFGFDGIDFDWEYPNFEHRGQAPYGKTDSGSPDDMRDCATDACVGDRTQDGVNFVATLSLLSTKLSAIRSPRGERYQVSMAAPAGADKLARMPLADVCASMDHVNIMTYDMAGAWDATTGHQSALTDPIHSPSSLTVQNAVEVFLRAGCHASKLIVGVPFYGRAFRGVQPGTDAKLPGYKQPFNAVLTNQGPTLYLQSEVVTLPGLTQYYDAGAGASFAYSPSSGLWISYDNETAVRAKAAYVKTQGLGGLMAWALGQDVQASLWNAMVNELQK